MRTILWCAALAVLAGAVRAAELPQVLVIGDSISMGYTPFVKAAMTGEAVVVHNPGNAGDTKRGTEQLEKWLGTNAWKVIHFNHGLHDLKYVYADGKPATNKAAGAQFQVPPEQYRANLEGIVARLKKTGAKLIFATTTPVPPGCTNPVRETSDVPAYNELALAVMKAHGVEVNDLYAFVNPRLGEWQRPANVHFLDAGSKAMGDEVARRIRAALAKP